MYSESIILTISSWNVKMVEKLHHLSIWTVRRSLWTNVIIYEIILYGEHIAFHGSETVYIYQRHF